MSSFILSNNSFCSANTQQLTYGQVRKATNAFGIGASQRWGTTIMPTC